MSHALHLPDARYVQAATLEPHQQPTARALRTACDFREQRMLKHPYISEFHSVYEHLHAGLCEGRADIVSYTPKPFILYVHQKRYTPDVFVLLREGKPKVIEIKPRGEMDEAKRGTLCAFFALHNMEFCVISNESIAAQRQEAENWLEIVRRLQRAAHVDTAAAELAVLDQLATSPHQTIGDWVDPGAREQSYLTEIALYRLAHRGIIHLRLDQAILHYDTAVTPCI